MKNGPYELIVAPDGYPGTKYRGRYAYEHTVQWWKTHGEVPAPGMEIHHVNGNHRDNRIENLRLVTGPEHRQIHGNAQKIKCRISNLICAQCKGTYTLKGNVYRARKKRTPSGRLYCSRKCQYQSLVGGWRSG